jgi:hypothetical protein
MKFTTQSIYLAGAIMAATDERPQIIGEDPTNLEFGFPDNQNVRDVADQFEVLKISVADFSRAIRQLRAIIFNRRDSIRRGN